MKSFTIDPKDRALIRSKLPTELVAMVENSETKMKANIDDAISEFRTRIQGTLDDLLDQDFAEQLQRKIDKKWEEALGPLNESMEGIKQQIEEINEDHAEAAQRDEELRELLAGLTTSTTALETTLNDARQKIRSVGEAVGGQVSGKFTAAKKAFDTILK